MASAQLSQLRNPGAASGDGEGLLASLLARPHGGSFDPDAWHVMQERDNALIRDELMHGVASKAFVYSFNIGGKPVTGVSVVGARELASQYKGIKSRIVATVEKRGALFIFRTFTPLSIETRHLPDLADDDDFYECVVEVSDIKTGNSIEVRKKETKQESRQNGSKYDRPHYDVIAESKAYRNGVLSVLPQSVIKDFQAKCLASGNTSGEQTIQQRRAAASTYAAKFGVMLDRHALGELSFAELDGLSASAAGGIDDFKRSAMALGLISAGAASDPSTGELPPPAAAQRAAAPAQAPAPARQPAAAAPAPAQAGEWEPSPEEVESIRQRELAESGASAAPAQAPAPAARRPRGQASME